MWLSLAFGIGVAALVAGLAGPIVELMGGEGQTADYAVTYLRIASLGLPMALLALGGQGYLRGVADLRTPLVIVIAGNAVNVVLEVLFVYGFDWGIEGSAWGTVVAQLGMGAAFLVVIGRRLRAGDAAPRLALARRLLSLGKHIFVRTTALMSSFVLAGAVAARVGDPALGAHQVAFQLWIFLALVLDSIAIAGQIIVGRELGAARVERAYDASVRMIALSAALGGAFAVVMLAARGRAPDVFTGDELVLEQAALLWPLFALMQPLNGAVFALDGILIGAGDGPFLAASMVLAFACCAAVLLAVLAAGWGIRGVWGALVVLIVVRLATMTARFRRRRWLVTGWAGEAPPRPPGEHSARRAATPQVANAVSERRERLRKSHARSVCASSARGRGSSASTAPPRRRCSASSGSDAATSARAAATKVASSMPCSTCSDQLRRVSRRRPRCDSTSLEDAEVDQRQPRGRAALDLADRGLPGLQVDLRWRQRRQDEPRRRDPDAGRVARVERSVAVQIGDVVRRMARRRKGLEADDVALGDVDVPAGTGASSPQRSSKASP